MENAKVYTHSSKRRECGEQPYSERLFPKLAERSEVQDLGSKIYSKQDKIKEIPICINCSEIDRTSKENGQVKKDNKIDSQLLNNIRQKAE